MHSSIRYKGHGSGHLQNLGEPWEEGPGTNSMMGRGPWHVDDSIMKPGRILKNPGCLNTCTHLPSSNNSNLGDSTTSIVQPKNFRAVSRTRAHCCQSRTKTSIFRVSKGRQKGLSKCALLRLQLHLRLPQRQTKNMELLPNASSASASAAALT